MPSTSITTPSTTSAKPKLRAVPLSTGSRFDSFSFLKNWKIVKPNPINDSDVRIVDISVRSALIRVRWNDIPVRRADSSVLTSELSDFDVTIGISISSAMGSTSSECGLARRVLPFTHLGDVALEEELEERPYHCDRAESGDCLPARADRRLDDVGRELERQSHDEEPSIAQPNGASLLARGGADLRTERSDDDVDGPDDDDQEGDHVDDDDRELRRLDEPFFHCLPSMGGASVRRAARVLHHSLRLLERGLQAQRVGALRRRKFHEALQVRSDERSCCRR